MIVLALVVFATALFGLLWIVLGFWFALQFTIVGAVSIGLSALATLFVNTDTATVLLVPFAGIGFVVALAITKALSHLRD